MYIVTHHEKKWVSVGHLRVFKWVPVSGQVADDIRAQKRNAWILRKQKKAERKARRRLLQAASSSDLSNKAKAERGPDAGRRQGTQTIARDSLSEAVAVLRAQKA